MDSEAECDEMLEEESKLRCAFFQQYSFDKKSFLGAVSDSLFILTCYRGLALLSISAGRSTQPTIW